MQHAGSFHAAYGLLSSCGTWAPEHAGSLAEAHGLSSCGMQAWLPRSMWDLSSLTRDRTSVLLHWKADFLPLDHQGNPSLKCFNAGCQVDIFILETHVLLGRKMFCVFSFFLSFFPLSHWNYLMELTWLKLLNVFLLFSLSFYSSLGTLSSTSI